jgi:hypothetical protein
MTSPMTGEADSGLRAPHAQERELRQADARYPGHRADNDRGEADRRAGITGGDGVRRRLVTTHQGTGTSGQSPRPVFARHHVPDTGGQETELPPWLDGAQPLSQLRQWKACNTPGAATTRPAGDSFRQSLCAWLGQRIIELALEREMVHHLGYSKHSVTGRNHLNSRNGVRGKTVLTDLGELRVACPRDRDGTFDPSVVRKRQRRVSPLGPLATALLTPDASWVHVIGRFRAVFGTVLDASTIAAIAAAVGHEIAHLTGRPFKPAGYAVLFVGTTTFEPWGDTSSPRQVSGAVGLSPRGDRELVSLWARPPHDDENLWTAHLHSIGSRGLTDVAAVVCDDRRAQLRAVRQVWPDADLRVVPVERSAALTGTR